MKALIAVICLVGLTFATCARPERSERQAVTGLVQKAAASSSNYKTTEVRVVGCLQRVTVLCMRFLQVHLCPAAALDRYLDPALL